MNALHRARHHAVARTLRVQESIVEAIRSLGFVQADPIRAPARAQDLILRHRVRDYRAGDLERSYPSLPVSEDQLHVYGFLPTERVRLLHPRAPGTHWRKFIAAHGPLRREVLRDLRARLDFHPRDADGERPRKLVENAWGGRSSANALMLELLHYQGAARVVRRESGRRIYEIAPPLGRKLPARRRAEQLVEWMLRLYAPMPERSLTTALNALRTTEQPRPRDVLPSLIKIGSLRRESIAGDNWLWPADDPADAEADDQVRLLAPFDPIVWDRRRFEQLWGWAYRFEAYTPKAKRTRGYYALPMLFRERVIGWANCEMRGGSLDVELGFVFGRPRERAFSVELEAEIERLRRFLR
jgi:uncharacterized protein YcaQ